MKDETLGFILLGVTFLLIILDALELGLDLPLDALTLLAFGGSLYLLGVR